MKVEPATVVMEYGLQHIQKVALRDGWIPFSFPLRLPGLYLDKKQKIFSEKQKGFRDGLSYTTPQKSEETRGNAITQPRSHPIKKM